MIPYSICAFKFARGNLNSNKRFKTPESCWDEMETLHTRPAHALASTIFGRSAHALSDGLLESMARWKKMLYNIACYNSGTMPVRSSICYVALNPLDLWKQLLTNWASQTTSPVVPRCFVYTQSNGPNNCKIFLNSKSKNRSRSPGFIDVFLQWVGVSVGFMPVLCLKCILETAASRQNVVSMSLLLGRSMDHPSAHHLRWRTTGVEN